MFSGISFFVSLLQWALISVSYFKRWAQVFGIVFVYPSPILLFFTILSAIGVDYGGTTTHFLLASGLFNAVKYFFLVRAIYVEGINFWSVSAALMEALYVGASGTYLAYNNLL